MNGDGYMTATERLRRLLDERGIEWSVPDEVYNQDSVTYWQVGNIEWVAFDMENGTLMLNCKVVGVVSGNSVTDLTPERAIVTSLEREMCRMEWSPANNDQLKTEKADTKSQWYQLFGTPERAARTLLKNGKSTPPCYACLIRDECYNLPEDSKCPMEDYDTLLELLKGDA